jgi:hypothetical protein
MSQPAKLKFSELRSAHRAGRRQARLTRVFSPYAFAGTLDQPVRWHLFYDGKRVASALCSGTDKARSWSAGPVMSVAELGQPETLQARAKELLQQQKQAGLGVVLHLADQLDQGIVQEEFANPELFEQAGALIRENPDQVVSDLSEDSDPAIQWRYYPILNGQRAVVLRHQLEFLAAFETLAGLDIKVAVHSAPVEMLAVYLKLYQRPIEEKAHCFVFFYDRFTVVVPVHQGVLDFKVLPHRQQDVPATFGDDLFSLLERLGLVDSCVLLLVPCGTQEPTLLFHELDAYARRNQKSADGIEIQIPDHETLWGVLNSFAEGQLKQSTIQRAEFLSEYREWSGKEFPLTLSTAGDVERFAILSRESFWRDDQQSRERVLPKKLAILMLGLRAVWLFGALFLIGLGAWFALVVVTANQGEALRTLPDIIGGKRAEFERLNSTKQYLTKWDKTLVSRSQAWSTMDFLLGLLPDSKDVVWEKVDYAIKEPNSKPTGGQAAAGPAGFVRQWTIDGSCNDRGRADLEHLREAATLTNVFSSAAARLNDASFAVSGKRTVKADLREEGDSLAGSANAPATLPYKFRLVVTQSFPGNDPLALPPLPKSKKGAM